jgi:hypothetical protein
MRSPCRPGKKPLPGEMGSGGIDQNFLRTPKVNTRPSTLPLP